MVHSDIKDTGGAILEAARKKAYSDGLFSINMREIAVECGISVGTIYNYYPTKNDLLLRVVGDYWDNAPDGFEQLIGEEKPLIEKLNFIFDSLKTYHYGMPKAWLTQQAGPLMDGDISYGLVREWEYFSNVKRIVTRMLIADNHIPAAVWSGFITPEGMGDFITNNMRIILSRRQPDMKPLEEILRRVLYSAI